MKKIIKNSLSILFILILTSCGGGGGSETKVDPPVETPIVEPVQEPVVDPYSYELIVKMISMEDNVEIEPDTRTQLKD